MAVPEVPAFHGDYRNYFFLGRTIFRTFLPGGGAYCRSLRLGEYHGVHAPARKPAFNSDTLHAFIELGGRLAAGEKPPFTNGCADAKLIRYGDRATGRTCRRGEHYNRSAQPGIRSRAVSGWIPAEHIFFWMAAGHSGRLKIIYDVLLLRMFRTVRPPEEE